MQRNYLFRVADESNRIDIRAVLLWAPVKDIEPVEVLRVNNSEFTFAQGNSAEGITIFVPAIKHHGTGAYFVQPLGNLNS